jgi:hypothetical protein
MSNDTLRVCIVKCICEERDYEPDADVWSAQIASCISCCLFNNPPLSKSPAAELIYGDLGFDPNATNSTMNESGKTAGVATDAEDSYTEAEGANQTLFVFCNILDVTVLDFPLCPLPAGTRRISLKPTPAGYANNASVGDARRFNFEQDLVVSNATHLKHSIFGGITVTVLGVGFGDEASRVNVQFLEAERDGTMVSSNHRSLSFISPGSYNSTMFTSAKFTVTGPMDHVTAQTIPSFRFQFTLGLGPSDLSIDPAKGFKGDILTIRGSANHFGRTEGEVLFGKPDSGYPCSIMTWSTSVITCRVGILPAGAYQVRIRLPSMGDLVPDQHFISLLSVREAETQRGTVVLSQWDDAASALDGLHPLRGSLGGGIVLILRGSGFGLGPSGTSVSLCGRPCIVYASDYTSVTIRTPELLTSDVMLLAPRAGKELHMERGVAIVGDQLASSFSPMEAFDGHLEEDLYMPERGILGLDMPFESLAALTDIAVFSSPDALPDYPLIGAEIVVANFSTDWTTVLILPDGVPEPGWTAMSLPQTIIAQRMRLKCFGEMRPGNSTGCRLRELRFKGHLLADPAPFEKSTSEGEQPVLSLMVELAKLN